ncbi:ClpXP protease specificity-enhancing factor SspB [uncultured Litoreibacter sp.]|uniref:SspB family protein n=1 Tax=uncultured Litoreibacter sp. TaxID=1392394 RepID=UPI00262045CD|nr:ClpXP protease specificity-enhancing factor SspB [uncultured Litoreibacter sp.]
MPDTIDYGKKMHHAMRGLISDVLQDVADHGLPGEHHFFITFDTQHPDVEMADWLFDRYPEEMTVVIQHWYDALFVTEDGFQITLNFGDNPEPLRIPFDALRTFVDPSVEFGLRFESHEGDLHEVVELPNFDEESAAPDPVKEAEAEAEPDMSGAPEKKADVVSLDSFRKH